MTSIYPNAEAAHRKYTQGRTLKERNFRANLPSLAEARKTPA